MKKMYIFVFGNDRFPTESVVGLTSSLKELLSQINAGGGTWKPLCRFEVYEEHSINDFNYVFRLMGKINKKKYPLNTFGVELPGEKTQQFFEKIAEGTQTPLQYCLVDENGESLTEYLLKDA